ncbi:DUF4350 domain-containing protein [Chloroflexota bacterium]
MKRPAVVLCLTILAIVMCSCGLSERTITVPGTITRTVTSTKPIVTTTVTTSTVTITPSPSPTKSQQDTTTPEGWVLAFDVHHGDTLSHHWWTNQYRWFRDYAEAKGWSIKNIDVEPLTYDYLDSQGVTILVICGINTAYTAGELEEIRRFVYEGGGLLTFGNSRYYQTREVLLMFGVDVTEQSPPKTLRVNVQSTHPLMKDVGILEFERGAYGRSYFLDVTPPAYTVIAGGITEPYKPLIAAGEFGKGRMVVLPSVLVHGQADNAFLYRNALYWLQQEEF